MHVANKHNVEHETTVQFVHVLADLLEIRQLLVVKTEIVVPTEIVAPTEIAALVANVVARMLSESPIATEDSLMTSSHRSFRMDQPINNKTSHLTDPSIICS